jgi:ubiquinone/menaquinone biosynthesis C-methylase UbiE
VRALRRFLRRQFGRPTGLWGRAAGRIMAKRPSNLERIRWTLSLLGVQPTDRILEIGPGPGIAVEILSLMAPRGMIVGVDHSDVMVRQAARRNARAVREGRVRLVSGSASELPALGETFDKVFTINSIHFWHDPVECLKGLKARMKPGGLIAVTLQPRSRGATDASTRVIGDEVKANLELAGFSNCRVEILQTKPVAVACALGVNSR